MFFTKSEEKQAQRISVQSEVDRLKGLSPESLALEVLPALNSGALAHESAGARVQGVCKELLGGSRTPFGVNPGMLLIPVREALQRLEHANLVMQISSGVDGSTRWRITSAGTQALASDDVAARLCPTTG